jgi:RNA polymerase sigma-70 factor, ECF subfamily
MSSDTHALVDHLFRQQSGQMVAWLTRILGPANLELAEEVVQDALVKALQQWPFSGIPSNPSGWLFTVARNGALDTLRRKVSFRDRESAITAELQLRSIALSPAPGEIQDDELRMVFMCCHPGLPRDASVALSLKTVGGFSTSEIARAFLTSDAAVAQRIVRAKRFLRDERIPFDLPAPPGLLARLDAVLDVIYLMFNEGYGAHAGEDLVRQDLCHEAIRLGRLVAASAAGAPAADALVALMAFQASRIPTRVGAGGELALLEDQDRSLWDQRLIAMGFAYFEHSASGTALSNYHLEAAIAAIHAAAPSPGATDWTRILAHYDELASKTASPVVRLNRAVALARVRRPEDALQEISRIEASGALASYYLLPAVKGALLMQTGDIEGAAHAFREALVRRCSEPERRFLLRRLSECAATSAPDPEGNRILRSA